MSRSDPAATANGAGVEEKRLAHTDHRDREAADRRAREPQPDGLDHLIQRVRLNELACRNHVRHDRTERRPEERFADRVHGNDRDHVPELEDARDRERSHERDGRPADDMRLRA